MILLLVEMPMRNKKLHFPMPHHMVGGRGESISASMTGELIFTSTSKYSIFIMTD